MAWAKMPSRWLAHTDDRPCPLAALDWGSHRTHATAALMLMLGLSVRLNLSHRQKTFDETATRGHEVAVTYDELQHMVGFARKTVSKALMLLEAMDAVEIRREGRRNIYAMPDVLIAGAYCQVPQSHLMGRSRDQLLSLRDFPTERRISLNAMKLYLLLLARRDWKRDTAAISYDGIMRYTGMRREDIPAANSMLVAHDLVRTAEDKDERDYDRSKRYRVLGLGPTVIVDVA